MKEVWKDIFCDNSIYQVSNLGNVRSKYDKYSRKNRITKINNNYELLIQRNHHKGYREIGLMIDGKQRSFKVHRLVAKAFIPNIDNKSQINHINGIKTDNRVKNLEWCTQSQNMQHAIKLGLKGKKIIQYTLNNSIVNKYNTMSEAARNLNINISGIKRNCDNITKKYKNFIWKYMEENK